MSKRLKKNDGRKFWLIKACIWLELYVITAAIVLSALDKNTMWIGAVASIIGAVFPVYMGANAISKKFETKAEVSIENEGIGK